MPERDGYPAGVPCWIDTSQPDPEAAVEFYAGLFGWEFEDVVPPGAPGKYFAARIRGGDVAAVGSIPEGMPQVATWNTYVWVDSADEVAERAQAAGGQVVMPPFEIPGAGRMAVCTDPEGSAFMLWQAREHRGARVVNEHGSLNFNVLATRDPDRAKAYYREVFGWGTIDLNGGEAFTLPGYGDHLEELNPGMRAGMEQMGAPKGFEDVVAALGPVSHDRPGARPGWELTFAVDDADEIARRAAELGGTVAVAPHDAPWVRTTVITDPQGATFVANKFVPENAGLTATAGAASG